MTTTNYVKVTAESANVKTLAEKTGLPAADIANVLNKEAYRKAYSQREDVKAKRAAYAAVRNETLRTIAALLKEVR